MTLEIKNLSKKYTKDYIFRNFSYKFNDTGIHLIVGKSGSGKTTLMRLIAGLDDNYDGEIIGGGKENCSVAFQEYRLFEQLTALENVHLQNIVEAERASTLLTSLGFDEEDLSKLASDLSGGMKQRVSIARALFKKSPVICLDEPSKEIGKDNVEKLVSLLKEEAKHRLILIITHTEEDFSELECERIEL